MKMGRPGMIGYNKEGRKPGFNDIISSPPSEKAISSFVARIRGKIAKLFFNNKSLTATQYEQIAKFWSKFEKYAKENTQLSYALVEKANTEITSIHKPINTDTERVGVVTCDLGCGGGELSQLLYDTVHPDRSYAIDISKEQLKSTHASTEGNFQFNYTINGYKNAFHIIITKHTLVSMNNKKRKGILKQSFEALKPGGKLIIGETNLEYMIANQKTTNCESYPAPTNSKGVVNFYPKDGDIVNTVLRIKKNIDDCKEGETKVTLNDFMHTQKGMIKMLEDAGFKIEKKDITYVSSDNIKKAYIIYVATKPRTKSGDDLYPTYPGEEDLSLALEHPFNMPGGRVIDRDIYPFGYDGDGSGKKRPPLNVPGGVK